MRTVGERLVEGLAARGVTVVFGIPGVHTVELYRGLSNSPVRHVTARHEQGAAFMADGYARVSGKPGVAFVITGPGLTNALTAMAQARADSVPMLVISGVNHGSVQGLGHGWLHELPEQAAIVRSLCPTRQIGDPAQVGDALDWAFALLQTGRPGPVHLEVPTDVMPMRCPRLQTPAPQPTKAVPPARTIAEATARLNAASRVVILSGGGVRGQEAALCALAERLDAPVVQTTNARGIMHRHPLCVPGSPSLEAIRKLVRSADQVLAIGTEFGPTDYDMYVNANFPDMPGLIRIDVSDAQLARRPAAVKLCGDAGMIMAALLPGLAPKSADGAARSKVASTSARAELAEAGANMPGQLEMVEAIRDTLPRAIIVGDSTQPVYAANLFYSHDRPGGWFNAATGYGALGYATGAAVGAAMAAPGTPVICLIGDGGLQFSPGELRSAVDEHLPITYIIWNNAGFREIAEAMAGAGTEVIGCTPSPLKMEPFAAACDLPFQSVTEDPDALAAALRQTCAGPRMIEVRVGG